MKYIQTIFRMEKIKSFTELKNKGYHNSREIDVPNSDNSGHFKILLGSGDLVKDVQSIMHKKGIDVQKLRKDAVIANELVVSLSPVFFKDNELDYHSKFNTKNTLMFINTAQKYIKNRFKDNIAAAYIHLDETSPHIHFFVVAISEDKKSKGKSRLSSKDYFNRESLISLQNDYCNAFNQNESEEYKFTYTKNSKAKHTTLREFYKTTNQIKEIMDDKDKEIKKLKISSATDNYLNNNTYIPEALIKENSILKEENQKLKSILESIKITLSSFLIDKIFLFESYVVNYFKFEKEEKTEKEKMIEFFNSNEEIRINNQGNENETNFGIKSKLINDKP